MITPLPYTTRLNRSQTVPKHSTTDTEFFKSLDFLGFPRHLIDRDGDVWSSAKEWKSGWKWKLLRLSKTRYSVVMLTHKRKARQITIHRLLLLAFVGPCPEGMQACHNNGNPFDNRLENLRWDTPKGNQGDRVKHGTHTKGTQNGRAKLTEEQVREIRRLYAAGGISQSKLGKRYGVCQDNISDIVRRTTWSEVE